MTSKTSLDALIALMGLAVWVSFPSKSVQESHPILLSPQIYFLLISLFILYRHALTAKDLGFTKEKLRLQVSLGVIFGLVPIFLFSLVVCLIFFLDLKNESVFRFKEVYQNLSTIFKGPQAVLLFLLAPVAEEIFFRGILFQSLRKSYSFFLSALFSSFLFMIAHGGLHIGALTLGFIAAGLTSKTKSILPGMIFHSLSNLYVPILTFTLPQYSRFLKNLWLW